MKHVIQLPKICGHQIRYHSVFVKMFLLVLIVLSFILFLFVSQGKQESGEECGRLPAEPVKDHGNGNGTDIEKPSANDEADSVGEGLYQCYGYFLFQKL